jgi:hypothetical protein
MEGIIDNFEFSGMENVLNNLLVLAVFVVAGVIIWKVSKTVISMVIGFVILVGVALLVWYVYKAGLPEVASGSGYFVVFVKGIEVLITHLKDVML